MASYRQVPEVMECQETKEVDKVNCPKTQHSVWKPTVHNWPGRTLVVPRHSPQASR